MYVRPIQIDVRKPPWGRAPLRVYQGDANATLIRATVTDGGSPIDVSRLQARFECVKPDGTWIREHARVKPPSTVEYVLPPQASAAEGLIDNACFRLLDGAEEIGSAGPVEILVLPSIDSAGAGESGSYCPELDGLMGEMRDLIDAGGAKEYAALVGKPSIEGRTLDGDLLLPDIGVEALGNSDVEAMFNERYRETKGI